MSSKCSASLFGQGGTPGGEGTLDEADGRGAGQGD